jgi:myo-inositol-1(or 4)-monophosphatase
MKETAVGAARAAGRIILDNFLNLKDIKMKGAQDIVTNVDVECQDAIIKIIKEKFPDHDIVSEENVHTDNDSDYRWFIDPIDGTINYTNGIPIACTSIALMKNDETVLGVVFDPFRDELFVAEKGKGAFLNDNPITVSKKDKLIDCVVCAAGIRTSLLDSALSILSRIVPNIRHIRDFGSAAIELCYTACGRADCYYCPSIHLWDCAAGVLMIKEAGGMVSNFEGKEWNNETSVIASNKIVHENLKKWLI